MYTFYVVHDTQCYMHNYKEKSDKNEILKVAFWGWVMFIFSNLLGGGGGRSLTFCAIMRGWVMFF